VKCTHLTRATLCFRTATGRGRQCLCVGLFTAVSNNQITVITMLMLMMVCIYEAVILTEV